MGNVHAQPLYIEGGPNGPMIIAVTASNNIYALNADNGAVIWSANRHRSCGHIRCFHAVISVPLASSARRLLISPPDHCSLTQ